MTRPPWQQLRKLGEILRWRGPVRLFLLTIREILNPFVYWYVFHIFETDLRRPLPEPYAKGEFRVAIYAGLDDLERRKSELASMGELSESEIESRFSEGDAVAVAYEGREPIGCMWLKFSSGMELALGTAWIINPHEALRYGSFVRPAWRGKRIHSYLNHSVNAYARDRGIIRVLASISVLNNQSLSLPAHYQKAPAMVLTIVRVRGVNWTYRRAAGAPLEARFSKCSGTLTRSSAGCLAGDEPD